MDFFFVEIILFDYFVKSIVIQTEDSLCFPTWCFNYFMWLNQWCL